MTRAESLTNLGKTTFGGVFRYHAPSGCYLVNSRVEAMIALQGLHIAPYQVLNPCKTLFGCPIDVECRWCRGPTGNGVDCQNCGGS